MINVLIIILLVIIAILIVINLCFTSINNCSSIYVKGGMDITSNGYGGSIRVDRYIRNPSNFNPDTGELTIHPYITEIGMVHLQIILR